MNKKINSRVIRTIALQSVIVVFAITVIGGAVIVHNQFKMTAVNASASQNSDGAGTSITKETTTEPVTIESEYAYAGFTPKLSNITTDEKADLSKVIVNGDYCLPEDYTPVLKEAVAGSGINLDYRVASYYQAMYDAAQEDNITLKPVSGYRSYDHQKKNFEARIQTYIDSGMTREEATVEAAKIIMVPGSSEHNAGLAMDICSLAESFENTKEFVWLSENAADYGFILRYPKNKTDITKVTYEPWHYRYVGITAAKEITAKGITLEEYLGLA